MIIPKNIKIILQKLKDNGFKGYLVGGCVRDSILNLTPNDYDITTDAKPEDIVKIFDHTIPTGLQHGTVTVVLDNEYCEITTFRIDGEYLDNRKPSEVTFTNSLKEDLSRRDLTINAIAYNEDEGFIDYFGGMKDLENKIIRCVGNENIRLREDALRILRVYRFSAQLGFKIDVCTRSACILESSYLRNISIERIVSEFNKILLKDVNILYKLLDDGILNIFLNELTELDISQDNPYHCYSLLHHTFKATELIEDELHLKLTMLFHDLGKLNTRTYDDRGIAHYCSHNKESIKIAGNIFDRLKYDNDTKSKVLMLIEYHDYTLTTKKSIKKMLKRIGYSLVKDLIKVKWADILSQNLAYAKTRIIGLIKVEEMLEEIISKHECFSLKDLAVNGMDLINMGIPKGKTIGIILDILLDVVIEGNVKNDKVQLLEYVKTSITY